MSLERYYAVDRIEGTTAVLVDDHAHTASVPMDRLPAGTREGVILRVTFVAENVPNWSQSAIDEAETARRAQEGKELLQELEKRDPGGDIEV